MCIICDAHFSATTLTFGAYGLWHVSNMFPIIIIINGHQLAVPQIIAMISLVVICVCV